jgi:MFS family permease
MSSQGAGSLWRDWSFIYFWLGRAISLLGTAITTVVLPILVYRLTGSPLLTSLLGAFEVIPYLVFGLFAGEIADRLNRRWLMTGSDLLNALLLGSIPVASWLHALTVPHIFVVALLSASAFVWFDTANFGALPTLVGHQNIVAANSSIASMSTVIAIIGPTLGGGLAALIGPSSAIGFDAASYLLSALSLALIPRALSNLRPQQSHDQRIIQRTFSGIREGIHFIYQQRLVRILTLLGFGSSLTGGAVTGLLVIYAAQTLHLGSNSTLIGLLFTAESVGSFVASLLLPSLLKRFPFGWITLVALNFNLLFLLILSLISAASLALITYAVWGLTYTLITTNGITLRQLIVPEELQSRVNAYARMVAWGGAPFGAVLGGLIAQFTTVRTAYLVMAAGVALSVITGWFSPLRERTMAADLISPQQP